jgi:glycosyltransferase involved in cell wall biosynthesis
MTPEMVSIIIPCYNAAQYVSEAIESALAQTYSNCEVIVVDDGSTDGSLDAIQRFGDKIQIKTGPNQGASAARNTGVELARGQWIQFLDADDRLVPNCVELKISKSGSSDEIVCLKAEIFNGYDSSLLTGSWRRDEFTKPGMFFYGTPQTAAPLYSKEDIQKIGGFSKKYPITQEFDFHLRLVWNLGKSFRIINRPGVQIRPRNNSLSRSEDPTATGRARKEISETLKSIMENHLSDMDADAKNSFFKRGALLAREFFATGQISDANEWVELVQGNTNNGMKSAYSSGLYYWIAFAIGFHAFERLHISLKNRQHKNKL